MITLLLKSDTVGDKQICKTIVSDIVSSKNGIKNLKSTYADDTYFCCGVDTYVQMIEAHMTDLKSKKPELFDNVIETPSNFSSPVLGGLTGSMDNDLEIKKEN